MRPILTVPTEFKVDGAKRQITGYASTFGNVDLGDDRVVRGAYTKTLAEDLPGGRIKVKRQHERLIGKPVHAEQDTKGLLTVSSISKTPLGDETLVLAEDGVITAMSIGYVAEQKSYANEGGRKIRNLEVVRLSEWSFVDEPMNPAATVVGVKSIYDVCEALYGMQSALGYLRGLASIDPDILARLRALLSELGPIASGSSPDEDDAAAMVELSGLVGDFQSLLRS